MRNIFEKGARRRVDEGSGGPKSLQRMAVDQGPVIQTKPY